MRGRVEKEIFMSDGVPIITNEVANQIWDVLCLAGANESERQMFVGYAAGREDVPEYRFRGVLGFGGKVRKMYAHGDGYWHVLYYPEDKTPEREAVRHLANRLLSYIK